MFVVKIRTLVVDYRKGKTDASGDSKVCRKNFADINLIISCVIRCLEIAKIRLTASVTYVVN